MDIIFNTKCITELLDSTFVNITGQISKLSLKKRKSPDLHPEVFHQIDMTAVGAMDAKARFFISKELAEKILIRMNRGVKPTQDEGEEYLKEYVNIVFGRMVSEVNNYIGKASRFSPPVIVQHSARLPSAEGYLNQNSLWYDTEQGRLGFHIGYTLNAE